jgi:cellulose synthase/poly-beta-1,6-N-acetylglucosamine synthase-like glycosyltransferase
MLHIYLYIILFSLITTVVSFAYYLTNVLYLLKRNKMAIESNYTVESVTIVVPVYNEKVDTFTKVIESIRSQGTSFIVVGDSSLEPYKTITENNGGKFVRTEKRGGKRGAMSLGIKYVDTKFVMFVDSDTTLPKNAVKKMLGYFKENTGGVGANISITKNSKGVSYSAEFMERAREVILKAMSSQGGSIMVIDGKCAIYRTEIVKPFMLSDEFTDFRVMGRQSIMGDDQQITAHIIKSGYKATKCYDVTAQTDPPENFEQFARQSLRWTRSFYYFFFRNLRDGTTRRAGLFYFFESAITFALPLAIILIGIFRFSFELHFIAMHPAILLSNFFSFILFSLISYGSLHHTFFISYLSYVGTAIFGTAVASSVRNERLRTMAYGGIALAIMLFISFYGFLTCWKQSNWLTR